MHLSYQTSFKITSFNRVIYLFSIAFFKIRHIIIFVLIKPTTRKIIKVLSDRELLIVEPSKEDKRKKLLSLSDKGQTLYVDVYRKILPVQRELIKMLDYLTWNLKMLFQ